MNFMAATIAFVVLDGSVGIGPTSVSISSEERETFPIRIRPTFSHTIPDGDGIPAYKEPPKNMGV